MEPSEPRYTLVMVVAQHGPNAGKPFFGFVNVTPTWAEYDAKFHHTVARVVVREQGCAPDSMVVCDLEDLPEFLGRAIATSGPNQRVTLPAFHAEPRHYAQARREAES